MQEAIPYKTWTIQMPPHNTLLNKSTTTTTMFKGVIATNDLKKMVKENAVIVFGKRGCCMNHVVKRLLQGSGVNPPVYEVDEKDEKEVIIELDKMNIGGGGAGSGGGGDGDGGIQFPAVFIGGQLFGGLDRIMATHITGELTPVLKKAGALWL